MTITRRYVNGLPYDSYSLHALRAVKNLDDVRLWAGLGRPAGTNYGANRNPRSAPIRVCFQHIAVAREMRDPGGVDSSAESVTGWGLNPNNRGASWPDCIDTDSWVPFLPAHKVRTWTQGVSNQYGIDWNTIGWGQEQGVWDSNWPAKPDWFIEATLRMAAAAWAPVVTQFNIPLTLILNQAELYRLARAHPTAPIGFTEHWVVDPGNRNDAGRWPLGGNVTTYPWYKRPLGGPGMFPMLTEELAIRAGSLPGTPDIHVRKGTLWEVTAKAGLNCRSGPGVNHDVIGSAAQGVQIVATGKTSGAWIEGQTPYQIENKILGWWHSDHLKNVSPPPKKDEHVERIQLLVNALGGHLDVDGIWGPITLAAAHVYAGTYGYAGNVLDYRSLLAHLEKTMENILTKIDELTSVVRAQPSAAQIAKEVRSHTLYGLATHWHWRGGYIPDPNHPNFPADPGSPAHHELVDRAKANNGQVSVYTAEGEVQLYLNTETGKFQRNPLTPAPSEDQS